VKRKQFYEVDNMARIRHVNTRERRSSRRLPANAIVPQGITRLSTGQEVKLININVNGGILIYSHTMLAPGSYVRLKMKIPGSLIHMDGRIQRCRIIDLKKEKVKYEAAIVLDGGLPKQLAERAQFLDRESFASESGSLSESNPGSMPLLEQAEIWILAAPDG
jgi:hypothetical protein